MTAGHHDVHGLVALRLYDAPPHVVADVTRDGQGASTGVFDLLGRGGSKKGAAAKEAERMRVLDAYWNTREIAGSALVELDVWRWLYANPNATASELREATVRIAKADLVPTAVTAELAGLAMQARGLTSAQVEPLLADAERATARDPGRPPTGSAAAGHANVPAMLAILRAELARQRAQREQDA